MFCWFVCACDVIVFFFGVFLLNVVRCCCLFVCLLFLFNMVVFVRLVCGMCVLFVGLFLLPGVCLCMCVYVRV